MRLVRGAVVAAVVASGVFVGGPPATAFVGACAVTGTATASSLTPAPAPASFNVALFADCPVAFDHAGLWSLFAVATSPLASCATVGLGSGAFVGGGGPDGSVTGGGFNFTSLGAVVVAAGTLSTSGDVQPHTFTAELVAAPSTICGGGPTTITLTGTMTITDAVPTLDPQPGVVPCAVSLIRSYTPGVTLAPVPQTGVGAASLNCVGVGDEAGSWNFTFTAAGTDACSHGLGTYTVTGGSTSNHGTITSGSIDYVRAGYHAVLVGTIVTSAEVAPHRFSAVVAWQPQQLVCGASPVTLAAMSGPGAIVDG